MVKLMPRNASITIGSHLETFITGQLEEGRYRSASEVVRAGLRLLEDHETKVRPDCFKRFWETPYADPHAGCCGPGG
jgi:hypothetical protein